jgi:hypothetical protein
MVASAMGAFPWPVSPNCIGQGHSNLKFDCEEWLTLCPAAACQAFHFQNLLASR